MANVSAQNPNNLASSSKPFSSFPCKPYDIQLEFMNALWSALDEQRIGLFESPTGTGKTLSLICGALEWLEINKQCQPLISNADSEDDTPSWIMEQFHRMTCKQIEQRESARTQRTGRTRERLRQKRQRSHQNEAEFLLSDDEHTPSLSTDDESDEENNVAINNRDRRQIIICSRTHSQLTQFIGHPRLRFHLLAEPRVYALGELMKTRFAESLSVVTLASRKTLCLNQTVSRLKSSAAINEKCLELKNTRCTKKTRQAKAKDDPASNTSSRGGSCPFLKKRDSQDKKRHTEMINAILSVPMDIEVDPLISSFPEPDAVMSGQSLGEVGKKQSVCPYYATRAAVKNADVILLPYSSLLSQETRESLGIEVEGNVLIVDEGHNLLDAINNTHKAAINEMQLHKVLASLETYLSKFELRLAPTNCENIKMLVRICNALIKYCTKLNASANFHQQVLSVNQFLFDSTLDDVNFMKIVRWMKEARLPQKISNYSLTVSSEVESETADVGSIYTLSSFLTALHNEDENGCIVTNMAMNASSNPATIIDLTFILLNPAVHFETILDKCHAVILASGTLAPLSLIKSQLFSKTEHLDRLKCFSCSHIVPKERVLAMALSHGPSGKKLDLRYNCRSENDLLDELGRMLLNFCMIIPQGLVVFVPSFSYLETMHERFKNQSILEKLQTKKRVFIEPRGAAEGEAIFKEYKNACDIEEGDKSGGLLFSVVGGKMSEGINFGDGLGRCVMMLGLPFPNRNDPELLERMKYINKTKDSAFILDSHEYYEDLCMKAVNQSIGRVIRHVGDYACIVLVDARYSQNSIKKKLPQWIQPCLEVAEGFGEGFSACRQFFKRMIQ